MKKDKTVQGKQIHRKTWMATEIFPIVIHLMHISGVQNQLKYTEEGVSHGIWHIEHLKRWIKKVWQRFINTEHMKKAKFQFGPCLQYVRRTEVGAID